MGKLRITESGLQLQGVAEFTDTLYAHTVASEQVCKHYWQVVNTTSSPIYCCVCAALLPLTIYNTEWIFPHTC